MTPTQLQEWKGEFERVLLGEDGYIDSNNIYHFRRKHWKNPTDKLRDIDVGRVWQWIESKLGEVEREAVTDYIKYLKQRDDWFDEHLKSNKLNIKELSDGYTVGIESGKEREVFVFPKTGECKTLTLKELNKGIRKIRKSGWSSE